MDGEPNAADLLRHSRTFEEAGDISASIRSARQAFERARHAGDRETAGQSLLALGFAFFRLADYSECERLFREALTWAGDESPVRADALRLLGITALETNQAEEGEDFLRRAITLSRRIGDDALLAVTLHALSAGIYIPRGQFDLALQADQESLRICRAGGHTELANKSLLTISLVYWQILQPDSCRRYLDELDQSAAPGSLASGYVRLIRAHLALDRGDLQAAGLEIEALLSLGEKRGSPELRVQARLARSRGLRLAGDPAKAAAWAEDAYRIVSETGYRHMQGMALIEQGRATWQAGSLERAENSLRAAVHLLEPLDIRLDAALARLLLCGVLRQRNSAEAPDEWRKAAQAVLAGDFSFLLDREADWVWPLVADYEPADGRLLARLRNLPAIPLRVRTYGGLRVWVGEREVPRRELGRRRADELFCLLLLRPGSCLQVDQIIEALFPNKAPEPAREGLYQACSALRRALEPQLPEKFPSRYLEVENGQVGLKIPPGSSLDFSDLAGYARDQHWEAILGVAGGGEFLPEMLYAEWTAAPRQRGKDLVQQALYEQAKGSLAAGQFQEALQYCQRLLEEEPWHEQAVLAGMEACLGLGDRAKARKLYRRLEKSLLEDLGCPPSEETQAFFRTLDRRVKPAGS